jgi:hypothetical protein
LGQVEEDRDPRRAGEREALEELITHGDEAVLRRRALPQDGVEGGGEAGRGAGADDEQDLASGVAAQGRAALVVAGEPFRQVAVDEVPLDGGGEGAELEQGVLGGDLAGRRDLQLRGDAGVGARSGMSASRTAGAGCRRRAVTATGVAPSATRCRAARARRSAGTSVEERASASRSAPSRVPRQWSIRSRVGVSQARPRATAKASVALAIIREKRYHARRRGCQ